MITIELRLWRRFLSPRIKDLYNYTLFDGFNNMYLLSLNAKHTPGLFKRLLEGSMYTFTLNLPELPEQKMSRSTGRPYIRISPFEVSTCDEIALDVYECEV